MPLYRGSRYSILAPSAAVASFSPTDVSGLALWLDASQISGKVDGDTVSAWLDASGNSRNGTASGTPIYRASVINGKPGVEFITAGRKFVTPSFLDSTYNAGFSTYAVLTTDSFNQLKVYAANGATKIYLASYITGDGAMITNLSGLSVTQHAVVATPTSTSLMHAVRSDATYVKQDVYGTGTFLSSASTGLTGTLGFSGALTVGDYDGSGFTWPGKILDLLVFKGALSDVNHALVTNYLRGKYALNWSAVPQVICDGNSLTEGTFLADPSTQSYPAQLAALLGGSWSLMNVGVSGNTTAQRNTADPAALDCYYGSNRSKNIAVLWEITNDLVFNQDASGAYSRLQTWCTGRRSAGFRVVVLNCIKRDNAGLYAGFETDRQAVNANIASNWASFADAYVDVGGLSQLSDASNTTYFLSDKVHLTQAGAGVVAAAVQAAVRAL